MRLEKSAAFSILRVFCIRSGIYSDPLLACNFHVNAVDAPPCIGVFGPSPPTTLTTDAVLAAAAALCVVLDHKISNL